MLPRWLAILTEQWLDTTQEFIQRLAADMNRIGDTFNEGAPPGVVCRIDSGLSDRHHDGRTVLVAEYQSGLKLVYKPKCLAVEGAYFGLLTWLNENGSPFTFKVIRVLNCETHGWMEYVENVPCQDHQQAQMYYRRAGAMLCLCYVLETVDCHYENLIACGDYPVLVDVESVMQHRVKGEDEFEGNDAIAKAQRTLVYSVLRIGLLPVWELDRELKQAYDTSGLGTGEDSGTNYVLQVWEHINTDDMALTFPPGQSSLGKNEPTVQGQPARLPCYQIELVDGFEQTYRFLMAHHASLIRDHGPLASLADQPVRFIFRPTMIYGRLLNKLRDPKYLRSGIEWSLELQGLYRAVNLTTDIPRFLPLIEAEIQALERLDIPYFSLSSGHEILVLPNNETVSGYFTNTSFSGVQARLLTLSEADLHFQSALITASIHCCEARSSHESTMVGSESQIATERLPLDEKQIVAGVHGIIEEIKRSAITADDGSVTWVAPRRLGETEKHHLQVLDFSLYDGNAGVALFLAATERIIPGSGVCELALGALRPIQRLLTAADTRRGESLGASLGLGGASGLGSLIYAFVKASQLLQRPDLLHDARRAALLITDDMIAADDKYDVIGGCAGAVLGLLALHQTTHDPEVLHRSLACADHLLTKRVKSITGHRVWRTVGERPLTGFSHGAAGIAYQYSASLDDASTPPFLMGFYCLLVAPLVIANDLADMPHRRSLPTTTQQRRATLV